MNNFPKDLFGPEYVVRVYDPKLDMEGFVVVHNTALGPGKGGIRMTASVTAEEVFRLARTMTWKNSLADIPFGGAKAGIVWKGGSLALKKRFIQSFARMIAPLMPMSYIAGPDVNTGEREMQWFVEATKNWRTATGKPANYCMHVAGGKKQCGIPHEFGSTGFGVVRSTIIAAKFAGIDLRRARVGIHGFGNVGTFAYQFLTELGVKVVLFADSRGALFSERGFDEKRMMKVIRGKKRLSAYAGAKKLSSRDFWKVPVDILIPASVTDVINESNKRSIKAKVIVEGANIPMSESIENEFTKKGVLIVPDFVANAGGVISSYAEYNGYTSKRMFALVKEKVEKATELVLGKSIQTRRNPRSVGMEIARKKVEAAMKKRKAF